jgi:hypothetical protein
MRPAAPVLGTPAAPGSRSFRRLASGFTTRLDLLLSAKRLLLHWRQSTSSERSLRQLHGEIDSLWERRAFWALRCPGDDARFWIGAYGRLAEICDLAASSSPGASDASSMREAAHRYRQRLWHWQGHDARERSVSRPGGR